MSEGRIDVVLDPAVVSECMELLAQLEERMPFLVRLQPAEKNALVKPHPGAEEVMQTIAQLQREVGMAPPGRDPMLADLSVYTGLTTIGDRFSSIGRRIDDTRMLAGSEGWNEGLIRYAMLRQLQRNRPELKTALDRIQPLITGRSSRKARGPADDVPQDPTE